MNRQRKPSYFQALADQLQWRAQNLWHQAQRYYRRRGPWRVAAMAAGGLLGLICVFVLAIAALVYTGALGALPTYGELRAIQHYNASEVYAEDGVLLGKYFVQNRVQADFEEISPNVVEALIATEDARFFEHGGIDLRAALRVLVKSVLLSDESSGGGSTLSQQLAKNLYPRRNYWMFSMFINKVREMMTARRLEKVYAKEELLHLYLNTVSFSENIYGIKVASQRFFNKSPQDLKREEAAVLIGMLKATTYYSPVRFPDRAEQRRNVVLGQMARYGYIDEAERDSLQALPLGVKYYAEGHDQGMATYFREQLRQEVSEILKNHTKPNGKPYNLYTDGLKIYTTIDARLQQYAEEAVREHVAKLQEAFDKEWRNGKPWGSDALLGRTVKQSARYKALKQKGLSEEAIAEVFKTPVTMTVFSWQGGEEVREMSPLDSIKYYLATLNAGLLAVDPSTGLVKAWVGGIAHKYFQYDHVRARRPAGSTFKPIVYAAALQDGMLPCEYTPNELTQYPDYDNWEPRNSDGKYGGVYSMTGALSHSVNTVAAELIMRTGVEPVRALAKEMGISSAVPKAPAIALGAVDVSLYELLHVYGTLANRGRRPELHYLDRIETAEGEIIAAFDRPDSRRFPQVLPTDKADMMIEMLESVVENGTARRLRYEFGLHNELAGKTGTTQNNSDGWFIGFNAKIAVGVWVGAEWPEVRFRSTRLGQGSSSALPIFGHFMRKAYRDERYKSVRYARFAQPNDTVLALMQCPLYLEDLPILAGYEEDGYYYFEDNRSLLQRLLNLPYTDEQGRTINVPPRRPEESEEEYIKRLLDYQQRLERRDERREKRRDFWERLLYGKDKPAEQEQPQPEGEQRSGGYQYFERSNQ
jgi:penicillin-binding protein 1A